MTQDFPRGLEPPSPDDAAPLATSSWQTARDVESQIKDGSLAYGRGKLWLGRTIEGGRPVGISDDRHVVLIAGSRAGKGREYLIPNLLSYEGSIICIDPKGENFAATARHRGEGLGQKVQVLDPFGITGACVERCATFNPLNLIDVDDPEALDIAWLIAEALFVRTGQRDAHWDESARDLAAALLLHVASFDRYNGRRDLVTVRRLLSHAEKVPAAENGDCTAFGGLLAEVMSNEKFDGFIQGAAENIASMSPSEAGSVLSTARRNTAFLESKGIGRTLRGENAWRLDDLKSASGGVSVYLVLPQRYMTTHARWLRMMITLTVARMEATPGTPSTGVPVLAMLDEFNVLGHMPTIESAAGYMAGFGLKLWSVVQDISQLKRHYRDSWETFLGNAGTVICFGATDVSTLKYVSDRLGETEVRRCAIAQTMTETDTTSDSAASTKLDERQKRGAFMGGRDAQAHSHAQARSESRTTTFVKTALMTPDEVGRCFSRESGRAVVFLAGRRPLAVRRTPYDTDSAFAGKSGPTRPAKS